MTDDTYKEFLKVQEEVSDSLSAMTTHLKRHELLIDKVSDCLPPRLLEEYGEFLIDWGRCLENFGGLGSKQSKVIMKILEEIEE